jgi:hypothetical protein
VRPPERPRAPRRPPPSARPAADPARRARAAERRRRERHFRHRRRDLLQDTGVALAITILLIAATAGLGVLALLMIPLAGGLIGSSVGGRVRRRRRRSGGPGAR